MCVLVLEYVLFPYFGNPSPRFRISFLYIQRDPSGQLIFYCMFAKKFKFQNYVAWLSIYHYQSTRQNLANDQMGQAEHSPGCQFNWLKNRLKNHLRSKFDSVASLNYPFLVFSQYRKSQVGFQAIFQAGF